MPAPRLDYGGWLAALASGITLSVPDALFLVMV